MVRTYLPGSPSSCCFGLPLVSCETIRPSAHRVVSRVRCSGAFERLIPTLGPNHSDSVTEYMLFNMCWVCWPSWLPSDALLGPLFVLNPTLLWPWRVKRTPFPARRGGCGAAWPYIQMPRDLLQTTVSQLLLSVLHTTFSVHSILLELFCILYEGVEFSL